MNRSAIGFSWRWLIAESVNQVCTVPCHIEPPEMNPLISGDPALLEKLIIDAVFSVCFRIGVDASDADWEATPALLASRLNTKYQVFVQIP